MIWYSCAAVWYIFCFMIFKEALPCGLMEKDKLLSRKYGFQIFFVAPFGFLITFLAGTFNDSYATADTHMQYSGLPEFKISDKFN